MKSLQKMAKAWRILMALSLWQALDQGLIYAFNFSLKYHVTNDPSGVAFVYGLSTSVVPALSNIRCGLECIRHECAAFSFQANLCFMEGVGSENGLSVVGAQIFRQWTENRAYLKTVYTSGGYYGGAGPENAVNDHTCLTYSSTAKECCHATYASPNRWAVVDLGAPMRVHVVAVGTKRILHTEVRVGQQLLLTGDFSSYELLGICSTGVRGGYMKFSKKSGIVGRYISIHQIPYGNLFLCDVVVLADD